MISSLELARLCGVSQGTVDRALHGRAGISAKTRARILAVAEKRGYRPNPAAREIMTGVSPLVGGIIPSLQGLFFMDLMEEVKTALAARGFRLLLTTVSTAPEFLEVLAKFSARRLRAVVAVPPDEGIVVSSKLLSGMRMVTLLSPVGGSSRVPLVAPDEVETGRQATERLLAAGHRKVAHITYQRAAMAIRDRAAGYVNAMQSAGFEPVVLRVVDSDSLDKVIDGGVTGLFCHNDWLAVRAISALAGRGVNVPDDVSVVGVDASPTFEALHPGLSTFAYPRREIAANVAALVSGDGSVSVELRCRPVEGSTLLPRR